MPNAEPTRFAVAEAAPADPLPRPEAPDGEVTAERPPILGIDALRLFAAAAVMLFHLAFKAFSHPGSEVLALTGRPVADLPAGGVWTWWGWVGVQAFFVISGLVIAFSAGSRNATAGRFVGRRILRLVPAVLIAATVALAVEVAIFGTAPGAALTAWARTIAFHPLPPWSMGQFWTLGIEVSFYALMLVPIVLRRPALLVTIGYALVAVCAVYWSARYLNDGRDPLGRVTQLLLLQHGAYFGMGVLISDAARHGWRRGHVAALVMGCLVAAPQIRIVAGWEAGDSSMAGFWPVPWAVFVATLLFAIGSLRWNDRVHAALPGWGPAVRVAGLMTYPLYLLHNHVGKPVIAATLELGLPPTAAILLGMAAAVLASWWVAVRLEPWVRGLFEAGWTRFAPGARRPVA